MEQTTQPQNKKKNGCLTFAGIGCLTIIGIFILLAILGSISLNSAKNKVQKNQAEQVSVNDVADIVNTNEPKNETNTSSEKTYQYEVKSDEDNGIVRNVHTVTNEKTSGDDQIKELTQYIQNDLNCNQDCNLSIYDTVEAYEFDMEYNDLIDKWASLDELAQWRNDHYVYVADHLIAFKEFEGDYVFTYPYQDAQYNELKGQ